MRLPGTKQEFRFSTKTLVLGIFFFLTICFGALNLNLVRQASAQIPQGDQPCNVESSPEFHDFRPYQADPCNPNPAQLAQFCGNDLVLQDEIIAYRSSNKSCTPIGGGRERCDFEITRDIDLAIDVSGAEFPIMGRTEDDVVNSQIQPNPEPLDDSEKVNEYVSWYLNGVTNAPEYGGLDPDNPEDLYKIINLTGPIKRLLPHRKQRDYIEAEIRSRETNRHNQVVGCVSGGQLSDCYSQGGSEIRLSDYGSRIPPKEEEYNSFNEWWANYLRWRGYSCAQIPIINWFFCFDNPAIPNFYADLYFQIPQSSTEDRIGLVEVVGQSAQPLSPNMSVVINTLSTSPADLFFAHQVESSELADILQSTYTPKEGEKTGAVTSVSPTDYCDLTNIRSNPGDDLFAGEIGVSLNYTADFSCEFPIDTPPTLPTAGFCNQILGGECFPSTGEFVCNSYLGGIGQYGCPVADGHRCARASECRYIPFNPFCRVTAQVQLDTVTQTPLTDDIWSRLVAGPMGVFKRIFPKVDDGAPIVGILDIPGATGVSFNLRNAPSSVTLSAGNPSNQRSALELYFPHVGGIDEYFLKCIQQALRPDGFGEGCLSGAPSETVACEGGVPALPAEDASCTGGACSGFGWPSPTMQNIFESAASFYKVPVSVLMGIFYNEGGFERYNWTEALVQASSGPNCQVPNCSASNVSATGARGPWQFIGWGPQAIDAVNSAVNDGRTPNPCNLLDSTFAAAAKLARQKGGWSGYSYPTCEGVRLNTGTSNAGNSCNWSDSDIVTAARQYLGFCDSQIVAEQNLPQYPPTRVCVANANSCYQTSVLNVANSCSFLNQLPP